MDEIHKYCTVICIYICIYTVGLFNDGHLSFELDKDSDSTEEPSLAEMTEKAIRILRKNPKGFFLLVEGMPATSNRKDNILSNFSKIHFQYNML